MKRFYKLHGTGNDHIIAEPSFFGLSDQRPRVDTFSQKELQFLNPIVRSLCRLHLGVGSGGCMIVSHVGQNLYKISSIDPMGNIANFCGNGLRCVAAFLSAKKGTGQKFLVAVDADKDKEFVQCGVQRRGPTSFWVSINLGQPNSFHPHTIQNPQEVNQLERYLSNPTIYVVKMSVWNVVVFISPKEFQALNKENTHVNIATIIRRDIAQPEQYWNIHICCVEGGKLKIVSCEQGAGVTLACGTGTSGSSYAAYKLGLVGTDVPVEARGGPMRVQIVAAEDKEEVILSGEVEYVFSGAIEDSF